MLTATWSQIRRFVPLQKDLGSGSMGVTAYLCRPGHAVAVRLLMGWAWHAEKKHNLRARMRARRHADKERRHRRSERTREFFDNLGQSMRRRRSDAISSGQAGERHPRL